MRCHIYPNTDTHTHCILIGTYNPHTQQHTVYLRCNREWGTFCIFSDEDWAWSVDTTESTFRFLSGWEDVRDSHIQTLTHTHTQHNNHAHRHIPLEHAYIHPQHTTHTHTHTTRAHISQKHTKRTHTHTLSLSYTCAVDSASFVVADLGRKSVNTKVHRRGSSCVNAGPNIST